MKVLYISPEIQGRGMTGGGQVRCRNLSFFQCYFGAENIEFFRVSHKKFSGINQFFEYCSFAISLKRTLRKLNPDLIYLDNSLIRIPIRSISKKYKVFSFFHNVEKKYRELEQSAGTAGKNSFVRKNPVNKIERNEKKICRYSKYIACLNRRDSDGLMSLYGRSADFIFPVSYEDTSDRTMKNPMNGYMLFVGSDFFGNTEGLFRFIRECLPKIDYSLAVVGFGMEKYNRQFPDSNVFFMGFVNDLTPWYNGARCVVLPISSGSGMKTKTCEALMHGKYVFASPEAVEGYDNIEQADVTVCRTAEEYTDSINRFLLSCTSDYSRKSSDYYKRNFSSEEVYKKFSHFMDNITGEKQ